MGSLESSYISHWTTYARLPSCSEIIWRRSYVPPCFEIYILQVQKRDHRSKNLLERRKVSR